MTEFTIAPHPTAHDVFVKCYRDRGLVDPAGWDVVALFLGGAVAGAVAGKDRYFHLGVLPEFRGKWASRRRLRQIAEWANARGYTLTKVRFGSVGAKMATIGGMVLKQRIAGGCEYAYAP